MWSLIASILMFAGLVSGLELWQRNVRRELRAQDAATNHQIARATAIAQRRHIHRHGGAHPALAEVAYAPRANGVSK